MMTDIFTKNCARTDVDRHTVQFVGSNEYMTTCTCKGGVFKIDYCEYLEGTYIDNDILYEEYARYIHVMSAIKGLLLLLAYSFWNLVYCKCRSLGSPPN
jgi:hypothetical protein